MEHVFSSIRNCGSKIKVWGILFLFAWFFTLPFWLGDGVYIFGHDTDYHLASIIGMSKVSFSEMFNIKILDTICGGLGYGEGIFYPQFSHVLPAIILKIGEPFGMTVYIASMVASFLILFLSGVVVYRLFMLLKKNCRGGLIAAILYMGATYGLSDILVRDARAESAVFLFVPIIGIALYYLAYEQYRKFLPIFVAGCVGLVNSHLVMTMYVAFFFLVFVTINWKRFISARKVSFVILGGVLSAIICLPFFVPLLQNILNTDYVAFSNNYMSNRDFGLISTNSYFNPLANDNRIVWALNIPAILLCIYVLATRKEVAKNSFVVSLLVIIGLSMIIQSFISLREAPEFIKMIQFPWRLNLVICFPFALLTGIAVTKTGNTSIEKTVFGVLCFSAIIYASYVHSFTVKVDKTIENITAETQTYADYIPLSSYDNLEYLVGRKDKGVIVVDGEAEIANYSNDIANMYFSVSVAADKDVRIEIPRLYYLGYRIKALYGDGSSEILSYSENDKGLIEVGVDRDADISVYYTGTKAQIAAEIISVVTCVAIVAIYVVTGRAKHVLKAFRSAGLGEKH